MLLKRNLIFLFLFSGIFGRAQSGKPDPVADTAFLDYDELFSELDALLDSLNTPRNFSLVNAAVGSGYFNYTSSESGGIQTKRQLVYSPSVGFFYKNGFGISAGAMLVNDSAIKLAPFQYSVTGSYDFLKVKKIITGISYTRFFTKEDLPFYTSPLQNEMYGYFTLRKLWFKPSVAASYGWGTRKAYQDREEEIENIQLAKRGYTRINTIEKIVDFNLTTSVRHDFYFLNTVFKDDFVRLTPQVSFTSGTQQFGFNQTSTTYAKQLITGRNVLYNTEDLSLDNNLFFQPLSLTGYVKTEYAKGKFFLQPQLAVDYYFPVAKDNVSTSFLVNAGFVF